MAVGQHRASRRALLGAAVALPVAGLVDGPLLAASGRGPLPPPAGDPPPRPGENRWRRALAAFEQAEAALRSFERRTAGAPWEEQKAVEEGMDAHLDVLYPALRRLLLIPAPDLHALATKIALIVDHEVGTDCGETCLALLKRDAWRLARGG